MVAFLKGTPEAKPPIHFETHKCSRTLSGCNRTINWVTPHIFPNKLLRLHPRRMNTTRTSGMRGIFPNSVTRQKMGTPNEQNQSFPSPGMPTKRNALASQERPEPTKRACLLPLLSSKRIACQLLLTAKHEKNKNARPCVPSRSHHWTTSAPPSRPRTEPFRTPRLGVSLPSGISAGRCARHRSTAGSCPRPWRPDRKKFRWRKMRRSEGEL